MTSRRARTWRGLRRSGCGRDAHLTPAGARQWRAVEIAEALNQLKAARAKQQRQLLREDLAHLETGLPELPALERGPYQVTWLTCVTGS